MGSSTGFSVWLPVDIPDALVQAVRCWAGYLAFLCFKTPIPKVEKTQVPMAWLTGLNEIMQENH